jgi:hypothetical protein
MLSNQELYDSWKYVMKYHYNATLTTDLSFSLIQNRTNRRLRIKDIVENMKNLLLIIRRFRNLPLLNPRRTVVYDESTTTTSLREERAME